MTTLPENAEEKWFEEKRAEIERLRAALRKIELATGATFSPGLADKIIGDVHDMARAALAIASKEKI